MRSVPAFPQAPGQAGRAVPFVGRQSELAQVAQHAERQRPEGPGIVVVTGASGMGRSAFLAKAAESLPGHLVLRPSPPKAEQGVPFALANELFRALHERGIATYVPPCAPEDAPHTAGQRLLTALTVAAASSPVTVVVDDVQHSDVASCIALGFAARRMYCQPILLLLAVRTSPDWDPEQNVRRIMPARGDVLHLQLSGLSADEVQTLGHALGVAPMKPSEARHIRTRCEGNPRSVTRLLEELRRDPHARVRHLPPSFSTTITDQILLLPEPSRSLLCALAVLNDRCPLSTVAGVAQVAEPLHALEPLLAAGLAEWWPGEPTTPVRMRSPLHQEAAYRLTDDDLLPELHRRAAAVVTSERALEHRLFAARGRPDAGLAEDLAAASWRWTRGGNLGRAAQFALWAADATEPGAVQDRRLLFGIALLQRDSQFEAAATLRDRARTRSPSALRDCVMGRYAMMDGDLESARQLLESAVANAERDPGAVEYPVVAALGYSCLALLHSWLGELAQAHAAAARCLAISPFGRRIDRGTELVYLTASCGLDGPAAALRELAGLVSLPAAPNEVDPKDSMPLILRGYFRLLTGEPAEALADIETGLASARHATINDVDDWAHFWAATACAVLGSWDRALEHATTGLDIVIGESRPHLSSMLALRAFVEARLGQLPAAAERATAAVDLAENFSLPSERMLPATAAAAVARAKGDPVGVVETLRPFAGAEQGSLRLYRWMWLPLYADALLDLGRIDDAEAALAEMAADIAFGYRVLVVPHAYLTGRALESTGDVAGAQGAYQRAIEVTPGLGGRDWRGYALRNRERLARGLEHGPPAVRLTEREQAIAGLIADGLTNKAVSGALGITEKTIEAHLTRVYRKLAVKSRGELRAALRGAGGTAVRQASCARSGSEAHRNMYANGRYRDGTGGPG